MGSQLYGYTRDEHEYAALVDRLSMDDGTLTIYVSAHGGGTFGQAYAGNGWDYALYEDGTLILEGSNIRSPAGRPAGHAEMARSLASFLSAAGESILYGDDRSEYDDYSETEQEWLAANYERLAMFANEDQSWAE